MSFVYLNSLTETEYNDLVNQLYDIQNGVCIICGKKITNPHIDSKIITIKSRAKFNIKDYALCHKACDIRTIRKDILSKGIENFEFTTGISFSFEQFNTDAIEIDSNNHTSCLGELEIQSQEDIEKDEFWQNEEKIYKAITYYEKAKEHKRNKKYKNAITALEKSIAIIHNVGTSAYPEIHSCLIDCYAKIKDTENQVRVIKLAIELYNDSKYTKMLNRINGTEKSCLLNKDSYQVIAEYNYGEAYDKHVKECLPEFDFFNKFIPCQYDFERKDMLPVIRKIDAHFQGLLIDGKWYENNDCYDKAVETYERLIAEGTYTPTAYERLIVLYSKANRKKDLIRILQNGISFFENRKAMQAEYVRALAKKYNAENYCEMCIKTGTKIRYYCGYIILYQDYPFVDKWKKRLAKLIN